MKLGRKSSKSFKSHVASESSLAGRLSLERVWAILFIGSALILAALAFFTARQISIHEEHGQRLQVQTMASAYAGEIDESMRHYRVTTAYIARDPSVVALLRAGDAQAVHDKEQALGYLFPSALRVRLLPIGVDTPDTTTTPPLSYACLDLLRQAETSTRTPPAEVHSFGTPEQHLDLVHSITAADGTKVGNLLVTLPVSILQQAVNKLPINGGFVEVLQPVEGHTTLALATLGSRPADRKSPAKVVDIKDSRWQLAYWPPAATATGGENTLVYWGGFGLAFVALALLLLVLYRLLFRALQLDQVTVIKLVRDIGDGTLAPRYPCRLRNCRGTIEQLQHLARERGFALAAKAPNPAEKALFGDLGAGDEVVAAAVPLPAHIFRAYDIRGIIGESLSADITYKIGQAIGSEAHERGQQKVIVARDGRLSGPELSAAMVKGLMASGREVIDVGRVPTPVLYFATQYLGSGSGVMVTGSHNPPDYNGFKIMLRGETLHGDSIQVLRERIETSALLSGDGKVQTLDVVPSYVDRITSDVRLARPVKVVVDCGNGVTGEIAPQLLRALGCEVIELYCEIDGHFPNHHPDPGKPENLVALTRAVTEHQADVGVAFDGDGDRLGVVDSDGKIIWPDRVLMLLAMDVLSRNPGGQIIYDVKCSRDLERVISENGGEPLMWKTGHSFIKAKMQETGALLAGEMSGHIFFKERWFGFDDALYACARLLEILAADGQKSAAVFAQLPDGVSTPELNVLMAEGEHFRLMQRLLANARFGGARLITLDGLRVEFADGWGLVRASNTTPSLVLRFEADDAEALRRIQDEFRQQLLGLDPELDLPF